MQVALALAALVAFATMLLYFGNSGVDQKRIERTRIVASKMPAANANITPQIAAPNAVPSQTSQEPNEPSAISANTTPSVLI